MELTRTDRHVQTYIYEHSAYRQTDISILDHACPTEIELCRAAKVTRGKKSQRERERERERELCKGIKEGSMEGDLRLRSGERKKGKSS